MTFAADKLVFCLLSFEGPDAYAQAGGLGVRITNLAENLAQQGYETHLIFIGDPHLPGEETWQNGRLILHRWGQWISARYPQGVYEGEEEKLADFNQSVPAFVLEQIIRPAVANGRLPVILAEEWHTADTLIQLHDALGVAGLRHRCVLFWNANNTMSFHRLNWPRLRTVAQLTTVSRYMKHLMWEMELNPLVIPNGIPATLLADVPPEQLSALKAALGADDEAIMLFKAGRFDPAKRWLMAVEAAAQLKAEGYRVVFPLRGGIEPHGHEVFARARELGLSISDVNGHPQSWEEVLALLQAAPPADIYNLRFFLVQSWLRPFYAAADGVLANSGHEPFGLVGLEAMASGGIVFTGASGEEYNADGQSAISLDTDLPQEIVSHLLTLKEDPDRAVTLRQSARIRAADFTWDNVSRTLLDKVKFVAESTGALPRRNGHSPKKLVRDILLYVTAHRPRLPRLPAATSLADVPPQQWDALLFDDDFNQKQFCQVAQVSAYPALARLEAALDQGLKLALGVSTAYLQQAARWEPMLLAGLRRLAEREQVELVVMEPAQSLVCLWDLPGFMQQMCQAAEYLTTTLGRQPQTADATAMMMSDTLYHALNQAGFRAAFMDGRSEVMEWRQATHLYHHGQQPMKLFVRHRQLSNDVSLRFSDQSWSEWPLMAGQYAQWLSGVPGDLLTLGWDLETFGRRHAASSGILDFLAALPTAAREHGQTFITPSTALKQYGRSSHDLYLPTQAILWAGNGRLAYFLEQPAQRDLFLLMAQAYQKASLTADSILIDLALNLAQAAFLRVPAILGDAAATQNAETAVPVSWRSLGSDGVCAELQQLYEGFIVALDGHIA